MPNKQKAKHPGAVLKALREKRQDKPSLRALADEIGVNHGTLTAAENKGSISPALATKLSETLGWLTAEKWVQMDALFKLEKYQQEANLHE